VSRQALLARTEEEVRSWLDTRSALAPGLLRALAADVLSAEEAGAGGRREAGGGREARGVEPPRPAVTADEVSLRLHALLYPRDNLTDVRDGVGSLAEQAAYIWFTREVEAGAFLNGAGAAAGAAAGGAATPPPRLTREPFELVPPAVPRSPKSTLRRRSSERAGAAWATRGGSSLPGGKTSLSGSPALRVLSAAAAGRVSQENALHAIQCASSLQKLGSRDASERRRREMVLWCCFPSRPSPPPRNVAPALRRPLAAR